MVQQRVAKVWLQIAAVALGCSVPGELPLLPAIQTRGATADARSLGLQLVPTLARQFGGELRHERGLPTGTVRHLRFLIRQPETVA